MLGFACSSRKGFRVSLDAPTRSTESEHDYKHTLLRASQKIKRFPFYRIFMLGLLRHSISRRPTLAESSNSTEYPWFARRFVFGCLSPKSQYLALQTADPCKSKMLTPLRNGCSNQIIANSGDHARSISHWGILRCAHGWVP
jgi:hypothetical protein